MMPTTDMNGSNKEIKDLMGKIKDFLKTGFKGGNQDPQSLIKYYWEVSRMAEQLIRLTLGENGRFPVDIELLAERLGAQIEEENLNEVQSWSCMNRKIGQIEIAENYFTKEKVRTIFVDKAAPPSSRRYAIAHELAHYITHYDDWGYYEAYCIMPMCPKEIDEIVADIFAIFLLIPVKYFFVEFLEYVKRKIGDGGAPVTTERWIRYLAERSMISDYYVAYGYQQLRYVAYWIYLAWLNEDELREAGKGNSMTSEDREQVRRDTKEYYTEEMGEWLFE